MTDRELLTIAASIIAAHDRFGSAGRSVAAARALLAEIDGVQAASTVEEPRPAGSIRDRLAPAEAPTLASGSSPGKPPGPDVSSIPEDWIDDRLGLHFRLVGSDLFWRVSDLSDWHLRKDSGHIGDAIFRRLLALRAEISRGRSACGPHQQTTGAGDAQFEHADASLSDARGDATPAPVASEQAGVGGAGVARLHALPGSNPGGEPTSASSVDRAATKHAPSGWVCSECQHPIEEHGTHCGCSHRPGPSPLGYCTCRLKYSEVVMERGRG